MTKAATIKAAFRILTLKCAKAGVPMLVTNHVYAAVGAYIPTNEIAGGSGLKYSASTIAMLSKKKDKDGTDVVGNIIKVKMYKSRLSKENAQVEVKLSYEKGLDRYYGLLDLAEKYGIIKKVSTRYEQCICRWTRIRRGCNKWSNRCFKHNRGHSICDSIN